MRRGLEQGFANGSLSGLQSGLGSGLQSSVAMKSRLNSLDPSSIIEPKLKPIFYINADNVALVSGAVSLTYNLIDGNSLAGSISDLLPLYNLPFEQAAGSTYRPPLVVGGLNGRNYMNFADTSARYLSSATSINMFLYNNEAGGAKATGTGMTWMFIIKRKQGGLFNILDARDSSTSATTNDLLLEVNSAGAITFDYVGGSAGSTTKIAGTSGVNLLNDWSILTVKCQLRKDGGAIPADNVLPATTKRYAMPSGARIGLTSPIDIFVNGVEQPKTITTNTFTNADYNGDGSFRMFDRDVWIGNKGSVFANSGTHIAAALMIPAYIDKAYQQRLENYFRVYYSLPF
jgi:hypothetical protein